MIHNYLIAGSAAVVVGTGIFFSVVIFVISLALVVYAPRMASKGVPA